MTGRFRTRWIALRDAHAFIARHHRHHEPAQGGIVALGLWDGDQLAGVGILGRPVSRHLAAAGAVECTRLCVRPGFEHAASALLGRLRRVAQALGFVEIITYTLSDESGASLRAAGLQMDLPCAGGGEWSSPSRPRDPGTYPTGPKARWRSALRQQREIEL